VIWTVHKSSYNRLLRCSSCQVNAKLYVFIIIPIIFIFVLILILALLYRRTINRSISKISDLRQTTSGEVKVMPELDDSICSSITVAPVSSIAPSDEGVDPKSCVPWPNSNITYMDRKSGETDLEKGHIEISSRERLNDVIDKFFGRVERGVVSNCVLICTRAHRMRLLIVDGARTLGLFMASFFGRSPTDTMTRSDSTFLWDMRPSPSMTMPGPRKMIEPPFVYVPYITVLTPDGDVEEEYGRWYHEMITATEAEQLQLGKMDCEQAKNAIHAYFDEKMAKKKEEKKAKANGENMV
jgi:hypothetical protein